MIDGIIIKCLIQNLDDWKKAVNLPMFTNVDTDSGLVRTKTRSEKVIITEFGKWETFNVTVKDVMNTMTGEQKFYLTLKGSLHKNHFNGANFLPFTWTDLQEQIKHIIKTLCINPKQAQISTLELGLNVCTPFAVTPFLRHNVINYKGNLFNRYAPDRQGICLGIVCQLSQYGIKIYDKGLLFNLPENLMRFELRYSKMQSLNKGGIKFLSDLQNFANIHSLQEILLKAWNDVLIFDIVGPLKILPLKQSEIDLLNDGKNPRFWERLKESSSGDQYKYQTNKFKKLVAKNGNNCQIIVSDLLKNEWKNLFKNYPNLPLGKDHLLPDLTIKIKGNNGNNSFISAPPVKHINGQKPESWDHDIHKLEQYFNTIKLPTSPIMLNQCTKIIDVSLFIHSHFETLKANYGNKTFQPFLSRLLELKQYIKQKSYNFR